MSELDHLLWATPELARGAAEILELTGVEPGGGGSHPGFGTHNALLSLGEKVYLEIIAPDPAQDDADDALRSAILELPGPGLLTFAARTTDIAQVEKLVKKTGLSTPGPVEMSRRRPDGGMLEWRILRLEAHPFGRFLPFFIDWGESHHPAERTPQGCGLQAFRVGHPDPSLRRLYADLHLDVSVKQAETPRLAATLETPKGEVRLESPRPTR